jgi:hypothetical protein
VVRAAANTALYGFQRRSFLTYDTADRRPLGGGTCVCPASLAARQAPSGSAWNRLPFHRLIGLNQ